MDIQFPYKKEEKMKKLIELYKRPLVVLSIY